MKDTYHTCSYILRGKGVVERGGGIEEKGLGDGRGEGLVIR